VCVGILVGGRKGNGEDEGEGIYIYINETEQ
jgi:hypothetical protein